MVFYWSLRDNKSQVSRTFLSILANLNTIVWMVSIRPPIPNSSSTFSKSLGIDPSVLITIGITVILMFYILLSFLQSLSIFFTIFNFPSVVCWDSKIQYLTSSFFLINKK